MGGGNSLPPGPFQAASLLQGLPVCQVAVEPEPPGLRSSLWLWTSSDRSLGWGVVDIAWKETQSL